MFQDQLVGAFEHADGVVMSHVAKLEQIPEGGAAASRSAWWRRSAPRGKPAFYEDGTAAIIERT